MLLIELWVIFYIATIVHEFGHHIAARIVGAESPTVIFGLNIGPSKTISFRGVDYIFYMLPIEGKTAFYDPGLSNKNLIFVFAGGAILNVLFAGIAFGCVHALGLSVATGLGEILNDFAIVSFLVGTLNLLPFVKNSDGHRIKNVLFPKKDGGV